MKGRADHEHERGSCREDYPDLQRAQYGDQRAGEHLRRFTVNHLQHAEREESEPGRCFAQEAVRRLGDQPPRVFRLGSI